MKAKDFFEEKKLNMRELWNLSDTQKEIIYSLMEKYATLQQPLVSGCVLKIELHEYGYSCGDGCCYNYGTITTVNGVELPCHNQDAEIILRQVLEHLGYKVEIISSDDIEEHYR